MPATNGFGESIDLLPVDQWVYNLYAVRFMDREGGVTLDVRRYVGPSFSIEHASDVAPFRCEWIEWEVVRENVPQTPRIGTVYGMPLHECGWAAALDVERYPL